MTFRDTGRTSSVSGPGGPNVRFHVARAVREVMMAQLGGPGHDAVPIGDVVDPPIARVPDPRQLFAARALRLGQLAEAHELAPYLAFLGQIASAQAAAQTAELVPHRPEADALARSRDYGMPALDRSSFPDDPACISTLRTFLRQLASVDMPADARAALDELSAAEDDVLIYMARTVLADAIPAHEAAPHILVAAGLQVHAARAAAQLDSADLGRVGDGICPACGSPPVSTVIVGWEGAHGARYCACSLCGTQWNAVRIRCTACGSTKGISYQELGTEGGDESGAVKAECCAECRTYAKVLQQAKHPELDPVADDVATLGLDLLLGEEGLRRSTRNPFLAGY